MTKFRLSLSTNGCGKYASSSMSPRCLRLGPTPVTRICGATRVSAASGVALERGDVGRVDLCQTGGATRVSAASGVALERGVAGRVALVS